MRVILDNIWQKLQTKQLKFKSFQLELLSKRVYNLRINDKSNKVNTKVKLVNSFYLNFQRG